MSTDTAAGSTLAHTFIAARAELRAAGLAEADRDARLIVAHALGLAPTAPLTQPDAGIEPDSLRKIRQHLARRLGGEPVSRILGSRGFWTLDLDIGPAVLDPRPDTETVVTLALDHIRAGGRTDVDLAVLDLGTGSGAILLALLSELPQAHGLGLDISAEAVAVAAANAEKSGLSKRSRFLIGDFGAPPPGRYDLVVSNPPYIRSGDIPSLAVEVRAHDPLISLDGGPDGLDAYRRIFAQLGNMLSPAGIGVFEHGAGQSAEVAHLAESCGLTVFDNRCDLAGHARALAVRPHPA
jgi:release factor glutamine methyltransferase